MKSTTPIQIIYGVGVILVVLSSFFAGYYQTLFDHLLKNMLTIQPDGFIYSIWEEPPIPIYIRYYFFNVTNPDDVQYEGAKPILVEMGPYTYLKRTRKEDVEYHIEDGTVSYKLNDTFYFIPDLSVGGEDDVITTLNPILVVMGRKMADLNYALSSVGHFFLMQFDMTEVFISKPVGELLYKGYYDPLVDFIYKLSGNTQLEGGKFGFAHKENGTLSGRYKVKSGSNGMADYLLIQEYKNEPKINFWNNSYCDMINGTDGTQFPPNVRKDKTIQIFTPKLCRSLPVEFVRETTVRGLKTFKFAIPDGFMNPDGDNKCYCTEPFTCRKGIFNLAPCKDGVPIIISCPHFYLGEKSLQTEVIGLNPTRESHETLLEIEPVTGIVARAFKRIQMNLPLMKYKDLSAFEDVPEIIMPILWAEESAVLSQEAIDSVLNATSTSFKCVYSICGVLVLCGMTLIAIGMCRRERIPKDKLGKYMQTR